MGRRFPVRHARHVFREFLLKNALLVLCFFFAICCVFTAEGFGAPANRGRFPFQQPYDPSRNFPSGGYDPKNPPPPERQRGEDEGPSGPEL